MLDAEIEADGLPRPFFEVQLPLELIQLRLLARPGLGRIELHLDLFMTGDRELVPNEDHLGSVSQVLHLDGVAETNAAPVGEESLVHLAGHELALDPEALVGAQGQLQLLSRRGEADSSGAKVLVAFEELSLAW